MRGKRVAVLAGICQDSSKAPSHGDVLMTYACFWLRRILWTLVWGVFLLLGGAGLFLRGTGPVVILLNDRQFSLPLGPLVLSLLGMFLFLILYPQFAF